MFAKNIMGLWHVRVLVGSIWWILKDENRFLLLIILFGNYPHIGGLGLDFAYLQKSSRAYRISYSSHVIIQSSPSPHSSAASSFEKSIIIQKWLTNIAFQTSNQNMLLFLFLTLLVLCNLMATILLDILVKFIEMMRHLHSKKQSFSKVYLTIIHRNTA
jgi:hypothetical protein